MIDAWIGNRSFDFETAPSAPDRVRVDVCGSVDGTRKPKRKGGMIEVRISRRRAVRLTVWTQLAHDIAQAASNAVWRVLERRS